MALRASAIGLSLLFSAAAAPALAVVGGAPVRDVGGARSWTVKVETSRGELCSGAAIAPDLVLTAAHCLMGGGAVRVSSLDPRFRERRHPVAAVITHPSFVPGTTPRTQPGTDLAMLRLEAPFPGDMSPLTLGESLGQGETVTMAGYGLSAENNSRTARRLRQVQLVNAGNYTTQNTVKVAVDIRRRGEAPGAGACRGDSGGPVLRGGGQNRDLGGIVSWSSGPLTSRVRQICGGFTAITPIAEHRAWISQIALALTAEPQAPVVIQRAPPDARSSWWFSR